MEMQTITLGGRNFWVQEQGSIEHDIWTMNAVRKHGLDKLVLLETETSDAFVERVLTKLLETGTIFTILAAGLVPEGQPWTPEGAEEVSHFLKSLREPEDKVLMQKMVVSVLIGFFAGGLPLWTRSRNSSEAGTETAAQRATSGGNASSASGTT